MLINSRNTRNIMAKLYVTFACNMTINNLSTRTQYLCGVFRTLSYTVVPNITYIWVIIYLMFRELVKISKKICFIGENTTFVPWVSSKRSRTPEQRTHYTPCANPAVILQGVPKKPITNNCNEPHRSSFYCFIWHTKRCLQKILTIFYGMWYDCTFKKQCTVPVTLTFDLWMSFFVELSTTLWVSCLHFRSISLLIAEK